MNAMAPVRAGAILHAGCGNAPLPDWIDGTETRLDIDGQHSPDIIASMTDLGEIGPFDSIYCSHALEHLYPHEAVRALEEFRRVLRTGGVAWIVVPNLDGIKPTFEPIYETADGRPITGFHMFYGDPELIRSNPYMAHHSGFLPATLDQALRAARFATVHIVRHSNHNLIGIGIK